MSPRHTSASPSGSSSGRRSPKSPLDSHPKTSREQFSACGACRMRRVRCDLKDLPLHKSGRHPSCTNCKERNMKCVDEYGQVKSVKLLRRGRRLQQAEALYGKVQPGADEDRLLTGPTPPPNATPMLKPEFFESDFWRRLQLQRPVIEPNEFCPRFSAYINGKSDALGIPGRLLAMSLSVWASSFGYNESGQPIDSFEDQMFQYREQKIGAHDHYDVDASLRVRNDRKVKTNDMLKEMLYLIDTHGILRKPTWDGVRLLLMILPLTQDVQSKLEMMSMYESTINLVYALTILPNGSPVNSGEGEYIDSLVRARTFWFSIIHDWMVNGLRGGRMILTDSDLRSFKETLPSLSRQHSSPASPHYQSYAATYRFFALPLQLSTACRLIHDALTGPEARRRNVVDGENLQQAWTILDKTWQDIDQVRSFGALGGMFGPDEVERYIASWQIFMFECNNIVREALKQRIATLPNKNSNYWATLNKFYTLARSKCLYLVQAVISIIKGYLGTPFFQYDAFLVHDGVFYAGFLLASEGGVGKVEDVKLCLSALREMRWAYSKSEERERTIRMVWRANGNVSAPQFSQLYAGGGALVQQQYTRSASLPRVDISQLATGSSPSTSVTDEQWPVSAVSSGGSDRSSPTGYVAGPSPNAQNNNIHLMETTHLPFANEGFSAQFVPEQTAQFDNFPYPNTTKPSPMESHTSAMYYQSEFQSPYYSDPSEQAVPTASEPIPGPSNYQDLYYHVST